MNFIYKSHSIENGAEYVPVLDENNAPILDNDGKPILKLIVTVMIETQIAGFPYEGKFTQHDGNVKLELDGTLPANTLQQQLPILIQNWIINKYPNI